MTKPKYLSAAALGIQPWERKGLIRFMRAAKTMKHNPFPKHNLMPHYRAKDKVFNMAIPADEADCGTVACIGGHVYTYEHGWSNHGIDANRYVNRFSNSGRHWDSPLARLYFPSVMPYRDITPLQAAEAVRKFLETGKVDWSHTEQVPA